MSEKKPPEAETPPEPPVERRSTWPDPAKMRFTPDKPDPYNASRRVDDKQKRRRTD